ncbi:centrosomal protein of 170 kDa protein B-like isoform X1 [Chiloscyllium plagiosum]|uniref:centrosomal protein of 170 kDa protein B-like isoform X1 n=1 Tax=Chiloscyllium plagiosum TaxID=36176 RepID=UPI001CB7AD74|nr:centrosomal protein of 170 kDa protein B-like isoform X1 [Chiloscyllium plagiosum]XP_043553516.1 centrosomal protein of 170 kDa protein B-like isoform X1 [Chiloscyllium plagiosum]XP_043553517.1 centrosomal protein of 170 kDa protein B-like isoform X1 [Chiloscyllium plagiosum]
MSVTSWFLVSSCGSRHRLPKEMIFVGREDCELMLQSRSVDKQHAVINYDTATDEHRVKDLGSLNGTFVNDVRIPDQMYITLKVNDTIRFGYDPNMYMLEKSVHTVPEEALKHEKYTSQFQICLKAAEDKKMEQSDLGHDQSSTKLEGHKQNLEKVEKKGTTDSATFRPTPLYGQPSWWGDDDVDNKGESDEPKKTGDPSNDNSKDVPKSDQEINGNISDYKDFGEKSVYSFRREPSYFEIPTKEFQQPSKSPDCEVHEIPTKDTDTIQSPRVQSHASFTIEFDDCTPGKMKIKDHVTKFPSRQRKLQQVEKVPVQGDVLSAENKVVDWLVQNDPSLMLKRHAQRDEYSTKSDHQIHIKTLKGCRHEDGTQSDSEDQVASKQQKEKDSPLESQPEQFQIYSKETSKLCQLQHEGQEMPIGQQAFVIEFFDDNPRKRRAHSFTQNANAMQTDSYIALRTKLEKRKGTSACEKGSVQQAQSLVQSTKTTASPSTPQRSNSLKREKTEERLSTSATSSSKGLLRSFGSVGRKSKLSQEFAAELLKETTKGFTVVDKSPDCIPVTIAQVTVAPSIPATSLPQVSSSTTSTKPASKQGDQDSLSDTGTYTIETETQDKEVEEARKMIDQVFGVFESPDFSRISTEIYRPVINDESYPAIKNEHIVCNQNANTYQQATSLQAYPTTISGSDTVTQMRPVGPISQGTQKWVSRWASLADGYNGTAPVSTLHDLQQGTGAIVDIGNFVKNMETLDSDAASTTSQSSRKRRTLPQLPGSEKLDSSRSKDFHQQRAFSSSESTKKLDLELHSLPQNHEKLHIHEEKDLEPDSLSDKSDDSSHVQRGKGRKCRISKVTRRLHPGQMWDDHDRSEARQWVTETNAQSANKELPALSSAVCGTEYDLKSASYSTTKELESSSAQLRAKEMPAKFERKPKDQEFGSKSTIITSSARWSSVPDTVQPALGNKDIIHSISKVGQITHRSPSQERKKTFTKESRSPVIRRESFTKDRPSIDNMINKIPNISSQPPFKDNAHGSYNIDYTEDTHLILKDTEAAVAALEAKLQSQDHHFGQQESHPYAQGESPSGESDNDTTSSVSLKSKSATSPAQRQSSSNRVPKGKSAPPVQDLSQPANALERLTEKRRAQLSDATSKPDYSRRFQLKRSTGSRGSTDFTDDERSSSLPYLPTADVGSSDQEQCQTSKSLLRKKFSSSVRTKEDSSKSTKSSVQTTLTRSNSLSTPRPTRASLLRRARLGDASDNESADVDKASLASEISTTSSTSSKQPADKKLSRLDQLALPRKRAGSLTVNSDTETSVMRSNFSTRSIDMTNTSRKSSSIDVKASSKKSAGGSVKQTSRVRASAAKSSSNSRWRQQTSDYTSTSEEEYNSNHTSPKHNRLHASTATHSSRGQSSSSGRTRQNLDDEEDPYENWTTHSAEIARLSQDLAKDLAILAREIHDVAGDGDSFSSLPPSTLGSTISAREEIPKSSSRTSHNSQLVQHIPEASLNFQKVPPESSGIKKDLDQNMNDSKDPDSKRRSWNREEVILDNLMWNSVSQLSQFIRENMEQTATKIKILFQNKDRNWDDIEAKINSENEVPILKTSNKEISSIFKDLRRVQKQLDAINTIIDPDGSLDALTGNQISPISTSSMNMKERTANTVDSKDLPKSTAQILKECAQQGSKPSQLSSDADSIDSDSECNTQYTMIEPKMEDTVTML